ncbi:hypothetical protein KM043_013960 [Ampulex compressa]|nr:hypothetical protein KM043_013960 [Ampulex compressa]
MIFLETKLPEDEARLCGRFRVLQRGRDRNTETTLRSGGKSVTEPSVPVASKPKCRVRPRHSMRLDEPDSSRPLLPGALNALEKRRLMYDRTREIRSHNE